MIADCLRDLDSVVVLEFTAGGRLIDCNAGFRRLASSSEATAAGSDIVGFFINPPCRSLASMVQDAPLAQPRHFTVGDPGGKTWTLKGTLQRSDDDLLFIAEHDIAGLERLNESVIALNLDLADLQRKLAQANQELKRRNKRIEELSMTDPMTGAANRRRLDAVLAAELGRHARHRTPCSVVMVDVDHFKRVNDDFGHEAGDAVLKQLVAVMQSSARANDLVVRYGGEEFVAVLPQTSCADAAAWAERVRAKVAQMPIPPLDRYVTASFGIAELLDADSAETLLARADGALYEAKDTGRNRVAADCPGNPTRET